MGHSVAFPKMSRKAESLIKSLCRQDPTERIGFQRNGINDIRKHRWFQGFDWEGLPRKRLKRPSFPKFATPSTPPTLKSSTRRTRARFQSRRQAGTQTFKLLLT